MFVEFASGTYFCYSFSENISGCTKLTPVWSLIFGKFL